MKEKMLFQAITGAVFETRAEAINDECKYLRKQIERIAILEQGCGGSATPVECWRSAKAIADDTIRLIKAGESLA